jgi:hypothetical protein
MNSRTINTRIVETGKHKHLLMMLITYNAGKDLLLV